MPQFSDVWVDIGAKDKEEAEELVRRGDPVTFALGYRAAAQRPRRQPRRWTTRSACGWCMEALRLLHGRPLQAAVYGVSTVAEEIGLRGATTAAYAINPTVGIAVDVLPRHRHAGQRQEAGRARSSAAAGRCCSAGRTSTRASSTCSKRRRRRTRSRCRSRGAPRATGTDANVMQISREGVAAGLDRHPEPLHAQPGRGGAPRRPDERGEAAGRVLRWPSGRKRTSCRRRTRIRRTDRTTRHPPCRARRQPGGGFRPAGSNLRTVTRQFALCRTLSPASRANL